MKNQIESDFDKVIKKLKLTKMIVKTNILSPAEAFPPQLQTIMFQTNI